MKPSATPGQPLLKILQPVASLQTETDSMISSCIRESVTEKAIDLSSFTTFGEYAKDLHASPDRLVDAAQNGEVARSSESIEVSDALGTADDPIVLSPNLSPVSLLIPISPVIHAVDSPKVALAMTTPLVQPVPPDVTGRAARWSSRKLPFPLFT